MLCRQCGTELNAGAAFCALCGSRVEAEPEYVIPTIDSAPAPDYYTAVPGYGAPATNYHAHPHAQPSSQTPYTQPAGQNAYTQPSGQTPYTQPGVQNNYPQGTWQPPYVPPAQGYYYYDNPGKSLAIASLVLGILSLVVAYFGLVLGIIGLALGISARKKSREAAMPPPGLATGGIVTSLIGVVISSFLIVILIIIAMGAATFAGVYSPW